MLAHAKILPLLAAPALLALPAPPWGGDGDGDDDDEIELDEAEVFIEFNSTDGDFGIQFFWDGDGWDEMEVEDPEGDIVLEVGIDGSLQEQGLTEGFFESVEPDLDELTMEEFLERFPEGVYEFEGRTLDDLDLVGETEFTHVMPAPPTGLWPPDGAVIAPPGPLVVGFDAVTTDLDGLPLEPELYEVVLESENDLLRVFSMTLPGDTVSPSVTIPAEFFERGAEYKFEVIVQEESGNRTISETEFTTL